MQFFYDGQIRRYLTQTIRVLSNFVVKYSDGSLHRIPVMYGDADRQAANIIRQNSENSVNSCPRIAVYISDLQLDSERLSDSTYVGKMHFRERDIAVNPITGLPEYTTGQGRNYTVERIMPTPFKLTMKVDIWSASTEQKLQILEQVLVLFNPSLELQTTDNYVDWTSLTVLNLSNVNWSSKTVPVGNDTPIDIATLTLNTPIWLSPPVKVKHLGVITKIITSLYQNNDNIDNQYIDGLGQPLIDSTQTVSSELARISVTVTDYSLQIYNNQAVLLRATENTIPREPTLEIPVRQGTPVTWLEVFDKYPGKYVAGSSRLFLTQTNGTSIIGTIAINPVDDTILTVSWDADTLNTNTGIDSSGRLDTDPDYQTGTNYRLSSPGTFDAIIDPTTVYPGHGMQNVETGDRFLIVDDISTNKRTYDTEQDNNPLTGTLSPGVFAWGDFNANANDIIEWTGTQWNVIFNSVQESDTLIYQTNIYTGVQYVWNGVMWAKSFEGEYRPGSWRIEL